jgi:hypothetical protein
MSFYCCCDGSPDGLRRVISEMGLSVVGATFYKVHGRPIEGSKLWEWGGFSFPIGVKNAILGQLKTIGGSPPIPTLTYR